MDFTYENQGTNTFMVYQVGVNEEVDSMSLGMITNNKILGFVPTIFYQQDNTKYFKYNISSKVSADQFLMGAVTKKRLVGVFTGIINAMLSAEEYMIDPTSVCLDLKYIFADVSSCETAMICLPILNKEVQNTDLKTFFKNIVFSTQFDQTENCDYVAKLINYLNSASVFSLNDFKALLDEIEYGAAKTESQPIQAEPPKPVPVPQPSIQPVVAKQVQPSVPVPTPVPTPATNLGFAVPGQDGTAKTVQPVAQPEVVADEKEISLMYLMQHYNKENAAIYKAQQEAKKAAKASAAPAQKEKKESKTKTKAVSKSAQSANLGFAIPGQQVAQPVETQVAPQQNFTAPVPSVPQKLTPTQAALQGLEKPAQPVMPQVTPAPEQPVVPQVAPAPVQPVVPQQTSVQAPVNFGETTVLSSSTIGETTVLGASAVMEEVKPYLIRMKNNEKIILDKPVFRIGKEKSYVDYFIGDNTAISRSHANVVIRDGEYFVVDTNSTNHTYVNGTMLQSNVETKIAHGAKIRLANEDFEFKIY